jgi:hypothetical protein
LFSSLLQFGCISQTQSTITTTATYRSPATITPLPTFTPYAFDHFPTATFSPLPKDVFDNFEELSGWCKVKTSFGVVMPGATVEEKVLSDMALGQISFSLSWSEGDLDLIIVQPDGTLLDTPAIEADKMNKSLTSTHGFQEYSIRAPEIGSWIAKIYNKSTRPIETTYMLEVSGGDATVISIHFDKKEYFSGDHARITAKLNDTDMYNDYYNRNVVIKVISEDPTIQRHSFDLYDDGFHGDEKDGDGIYANIFDSNLVTGIYKFQFKISGLNQRVYYVTSSSGSVNSVHAPFIRECFLSKEVK